MRINRYKRAIKHLNFFIVHYGFHQPFQLLVDGTLCYAALENHIQIKEEIPKYLGGDVKLLTTQCVILETERLGHTVKGAMLIAKSFGIHRCGHNKKPLSGAQCLLSMVRNHNKNRYIIATQDNDLQKDVQSIPGVPILYLNRSTPVLKHPSEISLEVAQKNSEKSVGLTDYQEEVLTSLKRKTFGAKLNKEEDNISLPRKKGPNPLSNKRKKEKHSQESEDTINKHKRKRKRVKLSKHVKEELFNKNC